MSGSTPPRLWLASATAWLGGQLTFGSKRRTARLLYGFARTEAQSRLELCRAASLCESQERSALYLRHAVDEARHAHALSEFASKLAREAGGAAFPSVSAPSEDLFERWGEARFLAFVHGGEERGRAQFEVYARLSRRKADTALAELFEALARDERRHEAYSARLLQTLAGARGAIRARRWAAGTESWRAFRRHGRRSAGFVYSAIMFVGYALLAPYALAFRWLSRPRRGFSSEP